MPTTYWWSEPGIPIKWATEHFLVVGSTGSGKTVVIRTLMDSIFGDGAPPRAIVFDPKRENYPIMLSLGLKSKDVHILNPFDSRSIPWDFASDIVDFASAEEFAAILIPRVENESQPFFRDAARQMLGLVVKIFIVKRREALNQKPPQRTGSWTLRDLICALRLPTPALAALFAKFSFATHASFYFENTNTFANVRTALDTVLSKFAIVAALWDASQRNATEREADGTGRTLSLARDWMERPSVLILGREPAFQSALEPINHCIMRRACQLVLERPERPHGAAPDALSWFFLDELKAAGKLALLPDLMAQGRSKGACIVLGIQNLAGIKTVYGETEALDLLSQCANKAILRLQDSETAKWAVDLVGENYVLKQSAQYDHSTNSSYDSQGSSHGSSQSNSVSQELEREAVAMASTFWVKLRPAGPQVGLEGFFFVPTDPEACQSITHIGPEQLFAPDGPLKAPPSGVPATSPRPPEEQELTAWTMDDLMRLGLDEIPLVVTTVEGKPPVSETKKPLDDVTHPQGPPTGPLPSAA